MIKPKGSNSFISVKTQKRKQPEAAKTCQLEAITPVDVNKHHKSELSSTPAYTVTSIDVTATMHENMQYNIRNYQTTKTNKQPNTYARV